MKRFFSGQKTKYVLSALTLMPLGLMGECAPDLNMNQEQYVTYMAKSVKRTQRKRAAKYRESRKEQKSTQAKLESSHPRFLHMKYIQDRQSPFFQFNVGVGFLYFSNIKANLGGAPTANFQTPRPNFDSVPFRGQLNYNRTPLFESILGYRLAPWIKVALSYQHQGGVIVNTDALPAAHDNTGRALLQSNLNLDALMAKVYLELPFGFIVKRLATTPYLALGVGPGWQSWTGVRIQYLDVSPLSRNRYLALNDKISANAVWMADIGFRLQDAVQQQKFSVVVGVKYNQWGQARNIGGVQEQGQFPLGLNHPFSVKTVYSFAPYLGVQWNFPPSFIPKTPIMVNHRCADSWVPFWVNSKVFSNPGILAQFHVGTQFNVGVGFLYFKNESGILVANGATPSPTVGPATQFGPLRGGFSYNRTPLFEYILGCRIRRWLRIGVSAQTQSQVFVQSNWQTATARTLGVAEQHMYLFSAALNLNTFMLRAYYDAHWSMIFKSIRFTPFLGAGVGPSWQTWRNMTIQDVLTARGNGRNNNPRFLKSKTCANASFLIDLGMKLKSVLPNVNLSTIAGVKFLYWGQARNLGLLAQQGGNKQSLQRPLTIKNVYSFAPYLGVSMSFPQGKSVHKGNFSINDRYVNTSKPFFARSRNFQAQQSVWTQFNMGIGFLYFSNATMTLTGVPSNEFNFEFSGQTQAGEIHYNRSPLYEYLIGYRFNQWIKAAISYQHQGGVTVQTEPQTGFLPNPTTSPLTKAIFRSNLQLDGLLAKAYLELPRALIFKATATSPYLGIGIGVGWQTWDAAVQHIQFDTGFINYITQQPLNRKVCANAIWMLDLGFRIRGANPGSVFSVNLGCKYNQWGQARNIGQLNQQGTLSAGISHPFRVKVVYQFAPYLGVQWDF